ncbi:MAG: zinc-finger domain-containing protein [Parvularculales bacterium]
MVHSPIPRLKNDAGHQEIRTGARTFQCIGASPPHDHPHVFLTMGDNGRIICPYCSTLYRQDLSLAPDAAYPSDAIHI